MVNIVSYVKAYSSFPKLTNVANVCESTCWYDLNLSDVKPSLPIASYLRFVTHGKQVSTVKSRLNTCESPSQRF